MRAWVVGADFGGEAEVGGWRGVELRREQRREGAVVKVDRRRGGVVERWGGEVAQQPSGIRTAPGTLKHGQALRKESLVGSNSKIPCRSYVPYEQQKNKRLLTTESRSRS